MQERQGMSSREEKQKESNGNEQNKRMQRIKGRVKNAFKIRRNRTVKNSQERGMSSSEKKQK